MTQFKESSSVSNDDELAEIDDVAFLLFNEYYKMLQLSVNEKNMVGLQYFLHLMSNLFSIHSHATFNCIVDHQFISFLLNIAKLDGLFEGTLKLLLAISSRTYENKLIQIADDYQFLEIMHTNLCEVCSNAVTAGGFEIVNNIILLLNKTYHTCSTGNQIFNYEFPFDQIGRIVFVDNNLTSNIILLFTSLIDYQSKFSPILELINHIAPFIAQMNNLFIGPLKELLNSINSIIHKHPMLCSVLEENFILKIIRIAISPTLYYEKSISGTGIYKQQSNSIAAMDLLLICIMNGNVSNNILTTICENIHSFFDENKEIEFLIFSIQIINECIKVDQAILQLANESGVIQKILEWFPGNCYNFKIHSLKTIHYILFASSLDILDEYFTLIFNEEFIEELCDIILASEEKHYIFLCMQLFTRLVEHSINNGNIEVIDIMRSDDICEFCHATLLFQFHDDPEILSMVNYLDDAFKF